jgi:hypothetical protein
MSIGRPPARPGGSGAHGEQRARAAHAIVRQSRREWRNHPPYVTALSSTPSLASPVTATALGDSATAVSPSRHQRLPWTSPTPEDVTADITACVHHFRRWVRPGKPPSMSPVVSAGARGCHCRALSSKPPQPLSTDAIWSWTDGGGRPMHSSDPGTTRRPRERRHRDPPAIPTQEKMHSCEIKPSSAGAPS